MPYPTYNLELRLLTEYKLIAGVDEAGRGPLAGPVAAAAVILNPDDIGKRRTKNKWWHRLRDCKLLTDDWRRKLAEDIKKQALSFGVGVIGSNEIDRINIHEAGLAAMRQAVSSCRLRPDYILIDGLFKLGAEQNQQAIVKGDQKVLSIAAASVLAKVHRDNLMLELHEQYPQYGFDKHKGYATKLHRQMIERHGICQIHRRSFVNNNETSVH